MGGNVEIEDEWGRPHKGKPVSYRHAPYFRDQIKRFAKSVNKKTWGTAFGKSVDDFSMALGSTPFMNDKDSDWLSRHKRQFGDVDLATDEDARDDINRVVKDGSLHGNIRVLGKKVGTTQTTVIGKVVDPTSTRHGDKVQIDLAHVPFADGKPHPLVDYMYKADARDAEKGLKGAHAKNVLASLTAAHAKKGYVRRGKDDFEERMIEPYSLSVRGLRQKYDTVKNEDGSNLKHQGRLVYKELDSKKAQYETDPKRIFKKLFKRPLDDKDMEKLKSTRGAVDLINKHYTPEQVARVHGKLVDKMYKGNRADMSFAEDPEKDRELKSVLKEFMRGKHPRSEHWREGGTADRMEEEYYKRRKNATSKKSNKTDAELGEDKA